MDTEHILRTIPGASIKQKATITIMELQTPNGPVIAVNQDFDPKIENETPKNSLPLSAKIALSAMGHIADLSSKPVNPPINN